MGRIVGGFGTSHILFPPDGVEEKAGRVLDGMMKIRTQVRALKPDVIVLAGSDHMNNFNLARQITLGVGVADEHVPFGDTGLPTTPFPGHRDFAEAFAVFAAQRGFDLVQVEEARPDHGMMIPKYIADPGNRIPIVPLWINAVMPIPPSPSRCFALGGVLKEMVETSRPADERVVVIGHGGLSHWLASAGEGGVNEAFDRAFIAALTDGKPEPYVAMSAAEIVAAVGNGGLEATSWLFMAGALPGAKGEQLYYESIPEWISGMGGLALTP